MYIVPIFLKLTMKYFFCNFYDKKNNFWVSTIVPLIYEHVLKPSVKFFEVSTIIAKYATSKPENNAF